MKRAFCIFLLLLLLTGCITPAVIWEEPYTDADGFGWDPTDPHPDNPYRALDNP